MCIQDLHGNCNGNKTPAAVGRICSDCGMWCLTWLPYWADTSNRSGHLYGIVSSPGLYFGLLNSGATSGTVMKSNPQSKWLC